MQIYHKRPTLRIVFPFIWAIILDTCCCWPIQTRVCLGHSFSTRCPKHCIVCTLSFRCVGILDYIHIYKWQPNTNTMCSLEDYIYYILFIIVGCTYTYINETHDKIFAIPSIIWMRLQKSILEYFTLFWIQYIIESKVLPPQFSYST